jgi:hypothetical protein
MYIFGHGLARVRAQEPIHGLFFYTEIVRRTPDPLDHLV